MLLTASGQIPALANPTAEDDPVRILQPFLHPLLPLRLVYPRSCALLGLPVTSPEVAINSSISIL